MSVIDAYLEKVAGQIRVKRAREPLIRELRDHMELQAQDYQDAGMEASSAQRRAVEDMGDALPVGGELDRAHRPRVQWKGLVLAMALLCAGLMLQAALDGGTSAIGCKRFFASVACAGLMLFFSLSDYTWWVRLAVPAAIPWLLLGLFRFSTLFSFSQTAGRFSASAQSAVALLFLASEPELICMTAPALSALLACALRGRGWSGFLACLTVSILPAALAFAYHRTGWNANIMALLALTGFAGLSVAVRRDFFRVRRKFAFGLLAGISVPTLILFLVRFFSLLFSTQSFFSEWVLPPAAKRALDRPGRRNGHS